MKPIKLCLMLAFVGAFAAQASAVGIPYTQSYTGPVIWHITNYEDSVVYDYNNGLLADNATPITIGQAYPVGQVKIASLGTATGRATGASNEASWGIFQVDQISEAFISGPNALSDNHVTIYDAGTSGYDVLGIFYGGEDQTVTFNSATSFTTESSGFNYEIFVQPKGTYDAATTPGMGPGARTDVNEFPTIGYDGTNTNTLLPGADLIVTMTGQPGMTTTEFESTFNVNTITGHFDTYMSVGPVSGTASLGSENSAFDKNLFPTGGYVPVVPGTTADFSIDGSSKPNNLGWLVRSSDPVQTYATPVPEPITMFGLLLGVGGISGYVRKRRRA
jgi:hypothetical protein